jgi:multiple sugar transport system substrate-binding protein
MIFPRIRRGLIWWPLAVLLFCTWNCGGRSSTDTDYYLTYWSSNNPYEIQLAREVVAEWNARYPERRVKHQPIPEGRSSEEVLLAAIVSKTTPDVYSNLWPGVVQQYLEAGVLVRLDTLPGFRDLYEGRLPARLQTAFRASDGGVYQFPWKANPIVLQYNRRLFQQHGVTTPLRTYSEFFQAAEILSRDDDGDGNRDHWMMDVDINVEWWHRFFDFYTFFIAASGGNTLLTPTGEVAFASAVGREVFRFFHTGFDRGYFPNAFFQGDAFLRGQVAVHISGPWNIAYLEKYKPEDFEYDFMPIPVPDDYTGEAFTYGDPKSICIFNTATDRRVAWEFVRFLVNPTNDRRLLDITRQFPIRDDLLTNPRFAAYFDEHPRYRFFAEMIPRIVGVDASIYLQEMFDIISQEFDAACIQGVKSPAAGIADAARRCAALYRRERR